MLWSKRADSENLKIIHVGALDGDTFGITLESGHTILLELGDRIHDRLLPPSSKAEISVSPTPTGKSSAGPEGCP